MTINVREFGAVGDGVTDDRPAIMSALNAAASIGGDEVFFPAGTYIVSELGAQAWSLDMPGNNITLCGVRGESWLKHPSGLPASSISILHLELRDAITIRDMGFDGNWGNAVTFVQQTSSGSTLPQGTITVDSTSGFPASGSMTIVNAAGLQTITYTAATATTFTGCTGGTGTIMRNNPVILVNANTGINQTTQSDPKNYQIFCRGSSNVLIQNCQFRQAYGDCIWVGGSSVDTTKSSMNVHVVDCFGDVVARDGVTIGGAINGLNVTRCKFTNIYQGAIFSQTNTWPVRNVTIRDNYLGGWGDPSHSGGAFTGNQPILCDVITGGESTLGSSNRNWRIENNVVLGGSVLSGMWDLTFQRNQVVMDWSTGGVACIKVQFGGGDIRINDNWMYTRVSQSGTDGGGDTGAIVVLNYGDGTDGNGATIGFDPANVQINGNDLRVRNGHHGIVLTAPSGTIKNVTGTATGTTVTSLTDSGATWATNEHAGCTVRVGNVLASISTNNSTTLTLDLVDSSVTSAWQTASYGEYAPTPALGAYAIHRNTGTTDVANNNIDCADDGNGAGGKGIYLTASSSILHGMRVRIHHNKIKSADVDGIYLNFFASSLYAFIDVSDNFGFDDQASTTFTNLVTINGTPNVTKWIIGGNIVGEGVTNALSGMPGSTSWLVRDGAPQQWAGNGAPEGAVTAQVGSTYLRLDGSSSTSFYVKESGTSNTGWIGTTGRFLLNVQTVSGSTYTPTTGTKRVLVRMIGGGGGGGGAKAAANQSAWSSGGASGSYFEKYFDPGAAVTGGSCSAGAAGSGGAATPAAGGTGGDSTITIQGTLYTAKGGAGGAVMTSATTTAVLLGGGFVTGTSAGDVATGQAAGEQSFRFSGTVGASGAGGSGEWGSGGAAVIAENNGNVAQGNGGGGSGGASTSATGKTGGAGTAGKIIVYEYT